MPASVKHFSSIQSLDHDLVSLIYGKQYFDLSNYKVSAYL